MAEVTFRSTTADGFARYEGSYDVETYQEVHDALSGTAVDDTGENLIVVNRHISDPSGVKYEIRRSFVFFDTSSIRGDAVITSAVLQLWCHQKVNITAEFDLVVQEGMPTYPHDPLSIADYLHSHYSGDGGSINTADITAAAEFTITLNATGRGWIKTGTGAVTKFCLRSSLDIAATEPAANDWGWLTWRSQDYGIENVKLIVDYTQVSTVTTQAVTDIVTTTATGNGNITDLGVPVATQHGHCWNTTGVPTISDSKTENGVPAATGAFTSSITGLAVGTKYYVRAYAINSVGTAYGNEVVFWADKGTVFPTDAITRVTNIIHRYNRAKQAYTMEVSLGDVTTDFGLPEWAEKAQVAYTPKADEPVTRKDVEKMLPSELIASTPPAIVGLKPSEPTEPWYEPVVSIWQGLTPWKEEEGETFVGMISDFLKGLFR